MIPTALLLMPLLNRGGILDGIFSTDLLGLKPTLASIAEMAARDKKWLAHRNSRHYRSWRRRNPIQNPPVRKRKWTPERGYHWVATTEYNNSDYCNGRVYPKHIWDKAIKEARYVGR